MNFKEEVTELIKTQTKIKNLIREKSKLEMKQIQIEKAIDKLQEVITVILFLFLPLLSNAQYSFTEVNLPTVSVNEYESDLISLDRDVKVVSVQEIIGDSIHQVGCSEINLLSLVSKYSTSKTEVHELETIVSYQLVGLDCISQTNFHYRNNRLVRIVIETTTHKESKTTLFNL